MSASSSPGFDRVLELLADQSTGPLASQDQAELDTLMAGLDDAQRAAALIERDRLQNAAAEALAVMMSVDRPRQVTPALRDRLLASGLAELGQSEAPRATPIAPPRTAGLFGVFGWLAAAAALVLAWSIYQGRSPAERQGPVPQQSVFAQRLNLLARQGTVTASWTPVAAKDVQGDVAWNAELQEGFLRLKGLAANDPAKFQYQLWIFDKGRIEPQHNNDVLKQNPVDGGVFDVSEAQKDPATGDYIVPIHAALKVFDAAAFAITSERPGGVVVTTRETIQALAPVGG